MSEYYTIEGYEVSKGFWNYIIELSEKHPTFYPEGEENFISEMIKNAEYKDYYYSDGERIAVDDYLEIKNERFEYKHEIGLIKFQTYELGDTTYIEEV